MSLSVAQYVPSVAILYFFYQDGCPACASAEPELRKFKAKYPGITVLELNLSRKDWFISGWTPKVTPGYLLKVDNTIAGTIEGALNLKQMEKWLKTLTGGR